MRSGILAAALEKLADDGPERIHLDQEGIVTADAVQLHELGVDARSGHAGCQFLLLVQREQQVGFDTDDERALQPQPSRPRRDRR